MNIVLAIDPARPRHRFDVHDHHLTAEVGILGEGGRVELINEELIEMVPVGDNPALPSAALPA